ncbi:MAG: di-trans,poly-cis-decaprenylcistransferase, partial [Proteobacteria bacterium]|nr:di-trans,poly-cis-decaprenylcistransferase [Pseudomonadota bacterium]
GLNLTLAFDYGAQEEIVAAAREMAQAAARGDLDPDTITTEFFASKLSTAGMPDPDLVIRTSGEYRLSNFLLWQSAYSEFVFLEKSWPDFTREDFFDVLNLFAQRERRFGAVTPEAVA